MLVEKDNSSIQQKFSTGYSRKDSKLEDRIKKFTKSEIQRYKEMNIVKQLLMVMEDTGFNTYENRLFQTQNIKIMSDEQCLDIWLRYFQQ